MPLLKGKKNVGHNIKKLEAEGRPHDQAVAIALNAVDQLRRKRSERKQKS